MNTAYEPRFGRMIPAMVTPFDDKLELDLKQARALARRLVEGGADSLIINGTTGESPTVFYPQKMKLFEAVVSEVGGEVPIIANVGDNCTADTVDFAKDVQKLGVDGFMLVVPYYNKPPQEGLYQHFKTIAEAVDLPCILYNIPGRCVVNMTAETTLRLANDVDNIVAIKEASSNISQIGHLFAIANGDIDVYSGNDDQIVPLLSLGGKGVISVLSNIAPQQTHDMVQKFFDGDVAGAAKMQLDAMNLVNALFCEVNPIPVKKAVELMGLAGGTVRLPMTEIEPQNAERLAGAMREYGLLD